MRKAIITGTLLIFLGIYLLAENPIHHFQNGPITRGKKIYTKYCLTCHQQDGSGVPDMSPPLNGSPYVKGQKSKLIKIVLHGLKDNVEIDGETYLRPMPAFGNILKDQQVADVLTYIRYKFGNKATPVYNVFVKKIRLQIN